MRPLYTILSILLLVNFGTAQQPNPTHISTLITYQNAEETTIVGTVVDTEYSENLPFATVILSKDSGFIAGTSTDIDGLFTFKNIEAGMYDLDITYVGYSPRKVTGLVVKNEQSTTVKVTMNVDASLITSNDGYYKPAIGGELTVKRVNTTALTGKVIEEETGDPVIYGSVALYKNDVLITGAETDFDGIYSFSNIEPGTYDVEVSYVGFPSKRITGMIVIAGKSNNLNVAMTNDINLRNIEIMSCGRVPMIQHDDFNKGRTFSSSDIRRFAGSTNN
jgi:hypothetical protein